MISQLDYTKYLQRVSPNHAGSRSFVCMGYNSLYSIEDSTEDSAGGRLPRCVRLWTWLILCDDHTVISINEDPFPFSQGRLVESQHRTLTETRRNLVNVLRSLSRALTVLTSRSWRRLACPMHNLRALLDGNLNEYVAKFILEFLQH